MNIPNQSIFYPLTKNSLPIIEHLVKAYIFWGECLVHFTKLLRYTLGTKIDWAFLEATEMIFAAKSADKQTKLPYLERAAKKLDLLKFLLRIAWETKSLDNKKYITISEYLNEIGRQLGGWQRKLIKETPADKTGARRQ